jgi:hypothetical protein
MCDFVISRAVADLFLVVRLLQTSQRDLDPTLASLDRAHSSLYELDVYSIAMQVPVHSQHSHNKMEKSWNVHFVNASFKCSLTWRPPKDHGPCEADEMLLGLRS